MKEFKPGYILKAEDLNQLMRELKPLFNIVGANGIVINKSSGSISISFSGSITDVIPAVLGSSDGQGRYGWTALRANNNGTWTPDSSLGSASYSDDNCCREITNTTDCIEGDFVKLRIAPGQAWYWFEYQPGAKLATITNLAGTLSAQGMIGDTSLTIHDITGASLTGSVSTITTFVSGQPGGSDPGKQYLDLVDCEEDT